MTTTPTEVDVIDLKNEPDYKMLITEVIARRNDPRSNAWAAAVRTALTSATEMNALGYTERYLVDMSPKQRIGGRRAAAICASNTGAPQSGGGFYMPIGRSLRNVYKSTNGTDPSVLDSGGHVSNNAMLMQINSLPMLDVEQAANVFGLLIGRCADKGVAVNYYDLAKTLIYWGTGATPNSQKTRANVLTAFYTPAK